MDVHSSGRATRYVTKQDPSPASGPGGVSQADDTPFALSWEEEDGRNDPHQRFALYRLCECETCGGAGKLLLVMFEMPGRKGETYNRCPDCRGEGRTLQLLATCESPEAAGVALVTLAREGEWSECPLGLLDRQGEKGKKWLVLPWLPSARNVSDAGRTLRSARKNPPPPEPDKPLPPMYEKYGG